jgi:hypothetical protein
MRGTLSWPANQTAGKGARWETDCVLKRRNRKNDRFAFLLSIPSAFEIIAPSFSFFLVASLATPTYPLGYVAVSYSIIFRFFVSFFFLLFLFLTPNVWESPTQPPNDAQPCNGVCV